MPLSDFMLVRKPVGAHCSSREQIKSYTLKIFTVKFPKNFHSATWKNLFKFPSTARWISCSSNIRAFFPLQFASSINFLHAANSFPPRHHRLTRRSQPRSEWGEGRRDGEKLLSGTENKKNIREKEMRKMVENIFFFSVKCVFKKGTSQYYYREEKIEWGLPHSLPFSFGFGLLDFLPAKIMYKGRVGVGDGWKYPSTTEREAPFKNSF